MIIIIQIANALLISLEWSSTLLSDAIRLAIHEYHSRSNDGLIVDEQKRMKVSQLKRFLRGLPASIKLGEKIDGWMDGEIDTASTSYIIITTIIIITIIIIIITIIILIANEFMDLVQHLPGYATPIVDDNDIHTNRKGVLHRSVAHHHSNSKHEDKDEDKKDDGDHDEDPCKDDVCVVEYPTPINCEHSNDYYDKSDGSSSRRDDDVNDCRIKLEQDNLIYSGKISEGMENTVCINSAVVLLL